MPDRIRMLLLADTHLGFDLPLAPRVQRRRRGHDFQENYEATLERGLAFGPDLVVHGGDLFHRSRVPPSLAYQGLEPLVRVADAGVPVVLVPGNHERSRLPHERFARHPRIHFFDRPRVFRMEVRGLVLQLIGFPFERGNIRARFPDLLRRTGWRPSESGSIDVLCMHQCVEGATVGPSDFTFTSGQDVIRCRDIPGSLAAVVSGHIHRQQVLTMDLEGRPLRTPVLYPGSIERTSIAEQGEAKGFLVVDLVVDSGVVRVHWRFERLHARPMIVTELRVDGLAPSALEAALRSAIAGLPDDAIVWIRTHGIPQRSSVRVLSAAHIRKIAPATMNIEIRDADARHGVRAPRPTRQAAAPLDLFR